MIKSNLKEGIEMFKRIISGVLVFTILVSVMMVSFVVKAETTRNTPYNAIGSITVDGILDAGKYGGEIPMVRANDNWSLGGTDPGTTASLYTAWSDGKLYFFYDVKTTKNPLITGAAAYLSDAIDLYITGPGVGKQVSVFAGTGALIYNIDGTQIGRIVTAGVGYTIELEVPWATDPSAGSIAFAAVVEDNYKKLGTLNYILEYDPSGIASYDHIALIGKPVVINTTPFIKMGGISVDGVLDANQYSSEIPMVRANDNWAGGGAPTDPGTTASLYTAWSDGKLYFFYDVKTTKTPLVTNLATYQSDAIDLYITGPGAGKQVSIFAGTGELSLTIAGTQVGRVVTAGVGYTIELEIPWATDPSISSIKFAAVVEDNYKKLGTKNYVSEWSDTSTYDNLIFGKKRIAPYVNETLTVDGILDAGKYGNEIPLVRANDNWAGGGAPTDPGTTASLYTAWSDGKLYFFYDVKTTKSPLITGTATYNSDAIDLYITGPGTGKQVSIFAGTGEVSLTIAGTQVGRVVTAGVGYTIELEIPWATDPSISSIKFAAVVEDNYKKLGTKNYVSEWSDTSTYDNLFFEGKNIAPFAKPGDITVDGILEPAKYSSGILLVRANDNWTLGGTDPGTTAKLYTAWTDGKLYFFFDVKTTKASLATTPGAAYASDAIDLYLNAPVTLGGQQITVFAGTGDRGYDISGAQVGRVVTAGVGYTVELEIPWAVDPSAARIPFAAVVNDNYKKLGTKNYVQEWSSISTYDKLITSNKTVAAYNNAGAITVDGILDTNKYGTEISMVRANNNWTLGTSDPGTTAKLYTSWSAGKLYFFFDVKTPKASLVTGAAPYVSDAVELYLTAPLTLGGSQISIYAGTGDRGYDILGTLVGRVVTAGVGYTVELEIPWATDPSLGSIPFAAVVNDNCKKLGTKNYFEEWAGTSTYDNLILGLYKVANTDKLISNTAPDTTVTKFKASTLSLTASSFVLKDKSGSGTVLAGIEKVTTGTIVEITNGPTTAAYSIVIFGDVDGTGTISLADLAAIKLHLLNQTLLTGDYFSAGDTLGRGKITITDLLAVKKSILEIATINQNIYPQKKN